MTLGASFGKLSVLPAPRVTSSFSAVSLWCVVTWTSSFKLLVNTVNKVWLIMNEKIHLVSISASYTGPYMISIIISVCCFQKPNLTWWPHTEFKMNSSFKLKKASIEFQLIHLGCCVLRLIQLHPFWIPILCKWVLTPDCNGSHKYSIVCDKSAIISFDPGIYAVFFSLTVQFIFVNVHCSCCSIQCGDVGKL